jgi:hypothetical protein
MFSRPIAFVIGAGVGEEYAMPLGAGLKSRIASSLDFLSSTGDQSLRELLHERFHQRAGAYEDAGRELANAINSFPTIDEALKWFGAKSEVVELGKLAIVREILKAERATPLYNVVSPEITPESEYDHTWLPHFLSMVLKWIAEMPNRHSRT